MLVQQVFIVCIKLFKRLDEEVINVNDETRGILIFSTRM